MLRTLHLLMAIICFSMAASAQVTGSQAMASTIKAINSAPSIQAKFNAKTSDGSNIAGTLSMRRDRFAMVTPVMGTWYDGTDMWTYSKNTGETSLTTPTDEELLEANPFFIVNQYSTYYKPKIVKHTASAYMIHLEPTSKKAPLRSADITVDASTWLPKAINAVFSNDSGINIDITEMSVLKTALPTSAFTYPATDYPGVEVIDLR